MRKKRSLPTLIVGLLIIVIFIFGIFIFVQGDHFSLEGKVKDVSISQTTSTSVSSSEKSKVKNSDLPDVSTKDWELVLVNRDNVTPEMNPDLTQIDNITVDSRIADNARNFLAAAQAIDASEHLISGYRSVAYQEELFNSYVSQEMAADSSLTQSQAEDLVKTYSQPAGASEHQTGLAMDMSTVNYLNQSDADVVEKVTAIAPEYGFVLRFPKGKMESTGVDYEDWHFRYVGKESAKYMTENNLSLEEYIALLKENKR
ncbi:M15 family metallopeptidase [Streptococcus equinus]|uniref:D-alanyl-D-alanine carboxypeptidase n=1 Tax=Streptococcus equinus TaxID=1335 RepID=A0A1G9NZL7_STREI|nr:M15 family metallopeptidase [Streptococcus equinus]SDL91849.1 D-alanyl-D-alanine carboxypeptidase [Streptococcus equinus]